MATLPVYDWNKKEVGQVELPQEVIERPVKKELLHAVVRWQLACRRQGTHKIKTRADVSGGGKKPFKQKGTGQARQGTSRSPLMPGGAKLFGPEPRDYSYVLPRKMRQAGLQTALSYLYSIKKFYVVKDMKSDHGKTRELEKRMKTFGLSKAVLIDAKEEDLFQRASRNLKNYRYYSVEGLNVYDLLKYDGVIVTQSSIDKILNRCGVK